MLKKLKFDKHWRSKLFFKNWYGVSVVNWIWSYSSKTKQTYEVAVLIWTEDRFDLFGDVFWWQTIEQIEEIIERIQKL